MASFTNWRVQEKKKIRDIAPLVFEENALEHVIIISHLGIANGLVGLCTVTV